MSKKHKGGPAPIPPGNQANFGTIKPMEEEVRPCHTACLSQSRIRSADWAITAPLVSIP